MKAWHLLVLVVAFVAAGIIGWIVDRSLPGTGQAELEFPDNIDYYLVDTRWHSFNTAGELKYQLKAPYVEHFVREDISLIQQPDILFLNSENNWRMRAHSGRMLHQREQLELTSKVELARQNDLDSMKLKTEIMRIERETEIARLASPIDFQSAQYYMTADSAVLDLKQGIHVFNKVKAVYKNDENHSG